MAFRIYCCGEPIAEADTRDIAAAEVDRLIAAHKEMLATKGLTKVKVDYSERYKIHEIVEPPPPHAAFHAYPVHALSRISPACSGLPE